MIIVYAAWPQTTRAQYSRLDEHVRLKKCAREDEGFSLAIGEVS